MTYRIRSFSDEFETSDSRKLKRLAWVALPTRQEGDGYTELMGGHPNGCAHFGAWTALIQLAAKCCIRGTLLRDLGGRMVPHDVESISRITRVPADVLREALPRLILIGWLEDIELTQVATNPLTPPDAPGNFPSNPPIGREKNRRTGQDSTGEDSTGQHSGGEGQDDPTPQASPLPSSPPEGIEDKKQKRRLDLLVILKANGCKLDFGGENIFTEWIDVTDGHKLNTIEDIIKTTRPRIRLPSGLRTALKGKK